MRFVGREIHDGGTESLMRKHLKAGVMNRGKYESTQGGGNESNVFHNRLDREETWTKGERNQNKGNTVKQAQISRIWLLA